MSSTRAIKGTAPSPSVGQKLADLDESEENGEKGTQEGRRVTDRFWIMVGVGDMSG